MLRSEERWNINIYQLFLVRLSCIQKESHQTILEFQWLLWETVWHLQHMWGGGPKWNACEDLGLFSCWQGHTIQIHTVCFSLIPFISRQVVLEFCLPPWLASPVVEAVARLMYTFSHIFVTLPYWLYRAVSFIGWCATCVFLVLITQGSMPPGAACTVGDGVSGAESVRP